MSWIEIAGSTCRSKPSVVAFAYIDDNDNARHFDELHVFWQSFLCQLQHRSNYTGEENWCVECDPGPIGLGYQRSQRLDERSPRNLYIVERTSDGRLWYRYYEQAPTYPYVHPRASGCIGALLTRSMMCKWFRPTEWRALNALNEPSVAGPFTPNFSAVLHRGVLVIIAQRGEELFGRYDPEHPDSRWDPLESTCRHASLSIL